MLNSDAASPVRVPDLEERVALTRRPEGRSPVMFQRWAHLLFLHWAVAPETIQATLPPGLYVDTYDDQAWLGVVPFFMQRLRPRFCPAVGGLSNFLELNLRTYVHDEQGRAGVWFYSLDANQRIAVKLARSFFSLPYVFARIRASTDADGWISFQSTRPDSASQSFCYREGESLGTASPGSLEFFLVERYLLFSYRERSGQLFTGRVHHEPYLLVRPVVRASSAALLPMNGFADPGRPADHVLMSGGVDVSVYGLQRSSA